MFVRVEDPAQRLASSDVQVGDLVWISDRRRQRTQRPGVRDALVGPVVVVEDFELTQGAEKVVLVPDQGTCTWASYAPRSNGMPPPRTPPLPASTRPLPDRGTVNQVPR